VNRLFHFGIVLFLIGSFTAASPAQADVNCSTYTYRGDDDSAFAANLPFTLTLGSTEYNNVFVSTNGTLTFGSPDGTYWDYPQTPSVSVAGNDWVSFGEGAYLSFGSTENTFCAEWSVRPFPQSQGELTQIRLLINRNANGGWHGEIVTFGWLPDNVRRGIRFERGQPVVPMEAAFDVNGGVPVEVAPAPTPSSFTEPPVVPTPEPTVEPSPTLEPSPLPTVEPTVEPTPSPTPEPVVPVVEPSPTPTPEASVESPTPTPSPAQVEPSVTPTPEPTPSPTEQVVEPPVAPVIEPLPTVEPITLEAPALLQDIPGVAQLFAATEAFMNIGNDMTPEQRKQSQHVVIAAVLIGQITRIGRTK
jgi:hypothetical protein